MKKILAVDNNPAILQFLQRVLTHEGYEVKTASDGLEALKVLDEGYNPDLFIIDLVMPNIDGEKLALILRSRWEYKDTPLIVLSGIAPERRDSEISDLADCIIAKMAARQLKVYLLQVIRDIEQGNSGQYKRSIIGVGEVHERGITKELLYCNKHFEVLLANISDGYMEISSDYRIVYANKAALDIAGTTMEELLGTSFLDLFEGEARETVTAFIDGTTAEFRTLHDDEAILLNSHFVVLEVSPLQFNKYKTKLIILKDITKRKQVEEQLRNTLKEINHRVKNNLANITALANIELEAEEKTKRESISDLINRIGSIEVMHELLYAGESFAEIDIASYIRNFVEKIDVFYQNEDTDALFNLDIEPLKFSTKMTTNIGIILSELITNSFKYAAAPEGLSITVSLHRQGEYCRLVYSDSGTGLAGTESIDDVQRGTGILLIKELVAGMEGTIELDTSATTTFVLVFKYI